jgi:hypothetical protein
MTEAVPNHTADELIEAIRNATDMNTLKRLVGPSKAELELAEARKKVIDSVLTSRSRTYGDNLDYWPDDVRTFYEMLSQEQTEFENLYL